MFLTQILTKTGVPGPPRDPRASQGLRVLDSSQGLPEALRIIKPNDQAKSLFSAEGNAICVHAALKAISIRFS